MDTMTKINRLKQKILNLGSFLPGSITEQWNVCGTPNCKCKDSKNPVKHGPYYQLSFTIKGKGSSFFIKKPDLAEARRRTKRFKQFKELCQELTLANVEFTRANGFKEEHNETQ